MQGFPTCSLQQNHQKYKLKCLVTVTPCDPRESINGGGSHGEQGYHPYFCHCLCPAGTRLVTPSVAQLPATTARGSTAVGRRGCCRLAPAWVCSLGRENAPLLPPSGRPSSAHTGSCGSAVPRHTTCCTHSIRRASSLQ